MHIYPHLEHLYIDLTPRFINLPIGVRPRLNYFFLNAEQPTSDRAGGSTSGDDSDSDHDYDSVEIDSGMATLSLATRLSNLATRVARRTQPSLKTVTIWPSWPASRARIFTISSRSVDRVFVGEPEVVRVSRPEHEWLRYLSD